LRTNVEVCVPCEPDAPTLQVCRERIPVPRRRTCDACHRMPPSCTWSLRCTRASLRRAPTRMHRVAAASSRASARTSGVRVPPLRLMLGRGQPEPLSGQATNVRRDVARGT
jgi:hypothetical protein